jgi:hypothetical protein
MAKGTGTANKRIRGEKVPNGGIKIIPPAKPKPGKKK